MAPLTDALRLLLLCCLLGLGSASVHDDCKNYNLQFERIFSVPGDVAMLNSTLLSPSVFNLSAEPFNVTWYGPDSNQPISNQSGRVLVMAETLWFLNVTLEDAGDYFTVVSTPGRCYRQQTKLVVQRPLSLCGRPNTAGQRLTKRVTDRLSCPLNDYIHKLTHYGLSYAITWYKGCERIVDGQGRFHYWETYLKVEGVESDDQGLYTCTLTFNLGGVSGTVSETIDAEVTGDYCLHPQIHEPANDVLKAELGANLTKRCLVYVPCEGKPVLDVDMYWLIQNEFILDDPSERVYTTPQRTVQSQDGNVWIERWLIISELKEDDFNQNYTCRAWSGRGSPYCYFTLLHTDPNLLLPVGLGLGSCLLLFLVCVYVYRVFKVDLVLWTRETFSGLYSSTASDGKLYDAYVAYPQSCALCWSDEVERFALHTLPQVLEEGCGYSLFIPERDSLPGDAAVDSVEKNLQVSRRIILLYTASTFSKKYCSSNNNNRLLSRPMSDHTDTSNEGYTSKGHLNTSKDHMEGSNDHLDSCKDHLHLKIIKDHLYLNISKDRLHLNTSKDHLGGSQDNLNMSKSHQNNSMNHLNTSKDHINTNNNSESISLEHLNTSITHLSTDKEHLNGRKFHRSWSQDPHRELGSQCGEDICGHVRTPLECVNAMHRALLERSLKVILVELEELGASDVEQLPESVRHLRQTQGAVCWWKTRTRRTTHAPWRAVCTRRTGDTRDIETPLSSCVSPNSRFWKEVRYRMPV
ncbi:interleukin-1 receptor-like 1 [Periophthalmus magnuspinnatus]|uniref:interleukin-1 receptor-like 1 n=1 Tax=Periophthalmus magnuspinnatus TaxID=409849 RepID=UPI00145AB008|nr:interleukin-1 receptor-like 1 [Periophthalmus magnuspinnatus]